MTSLAPPSISLPHDTVLVRYVQPGSELGPQESRHCLGLLTPEEQLRWGRFRFERDRTLYLVAHVLLRATLSEICDIGPRSWTFQSGEHGRPEIDEPHDAREITFNITHTRGLAACIVGRGIDVGIDAESLQRTVHADLPARYFSPGENRDLAELEGEEWSTLFFRIWTLKEAYLKARGLGISIPLDSFSFHIDGETLSFFGHEPERWRFFQWTLDCAHVLALAVGRPRHEPVRVHKEEIPLQRLLAGCER